MQNNFASGLIELLAQKDLEARKNQDEENAKRKQHLAAKVSLLTKDIVTLSQEKPVNG